MQWLRRSCALRGLSAPSMSRAVGWRQPPPLCSFHARTLHRCCISVRAGVAEEAWALHASSATTPVTRGPAVELAALPPVDYAQLGGEATSAAGRVRPVWCTTSVGSALTLILVTPTVLCAGHNSASQFHARARSLGGPDCCSAGDEAVSARGSRPSPACLSPRSVDTSLHSSLAQAARHAAQEAGAHDDVRSLTERLEYEVSGPDAPRTSSCTVLTISLRTGPLGNPLRRPCTA